MSDIVKRNELARNEGQSFDPFAMMRELMSWDPFRDYGLASPRTSWSNQTMLPSFDVKETADGFTIHADLPGVEEKDVEITLTGNRLTVSGHRSAEERKEGERWHSVERSYGRFSRSFVLPEGVEAEQVTADVKNGVLTINIPRKPETQPRQIKLGAGKTGAGKSQQKTIAEPEHAGNGGVAEPTAR